MPLKIIVVGAGIAGVCAAIALRQAGHEVEIFEKSKFATEVSAALIISPNGARVLSQLGFSFSAARAVKICRWKVVRGDTQEALTSVEFASAQEKFGADIWAVHRVDLHSELLHLAMSEMQPGCPVSLRLSSEVVDASADGSIVLQDGSKHSANLVVAADGLHSILKKVVARNATPPEPTGLSAFRFLIDTKKLQESDSISKMLEKKGPEATLLADVNETAKERHIICGMTQNFVGIHPSRDVNSEDADAVRTTMLDEFSHFSPEVLEIIRQSSHVKCWALSVHKPLSDWFSGRLVLIGDAAHPMLPFGGQGCNSAVEDGGSLGYLFHGVDNTETIPERLSAFERARHARASRVQILSSVRAGREKEVEDQLRQYRDPKDPTIPANMMERTAHDYGFDVFKKCEEVMAA